MRSIASTVTAGKKPELVPLTSLRFFAAFGVVLHHLQSWKFLQRDIYNLGAACVTFFFLLSGFILVYSYHDRIRRRTLVKDAASFYRARVARIYPVYLFTLCLAAGVILTVVARPGFELRREAVLHALLLQPYFSNPQIHFGFNGPAWSIGVEALFYAAFPFLLFLLARRADTVRRFVTTFALLWGLAVLPPAVNLLLQLQIPTGWIFYVFPPYRLFDFTLGMLLGLFYLSHQQQLAKWARPARATAVEALVFLGVVGSVFLAPHIGPIWMHPSDMLLSAAMILTAAVGAGVLSHILRWNALRYLGQISFSLYMIHYVIMEVLVLKLGVDVTARYWPWIIIVLCLLASDLLYQLVEEPGRKLLGKRRRNVLSREPVAEPSRL